MPLLLLIMVRKSLTIWGLALDSHSLSLIASLIIMKSAFRRLEESFFGGLTVKTTWTLGSGWLSTILLLLIIKEGSYEATFSSVRLLRLLGISIERKKTTNLAVDYKEF